MHVAVAALVAPTLRFARSVEEQRRALGGEGMGCESAAMRLGRHSVRRTLVKMRLNATVKLDRGMSQ